MRHFSALLPREISVFGVISVSTQSVVVTNEVGRRFQLTTAHMMTVGFAVRDRRALGLLERVRAIFMLWSGSHFPTVAVLAEDDSSPSLNLLLAGALPERLRIAAEQSTRLWRELYQLRQAHENLQDQFNALEGFLSRKNLQPTELIFENPVIEDQGGRHQAGAMTRLTQILPVSSLGLSAIEICVLGDGHEEKIASDISVQLRTLEDGAVRGEWRLPRKMLTPGWITLGLPKTLSGMRRTPELVISCGPDSDLSAFGLGPVQPIHEFCVACDGGRTLPHSLAFKAWSGLPGFRPVQAGRLVEPLSPEPEQLVRDTALPLSALMAAEDLSELGYPLEYELVRYENNKAGVLCHPPPEGTTLARLGKIDTTDLIGISCMVALDHEMAAPVSFALIVSDADEQVVRDRLAGQVSEDAAERLFEWTGWQSLSATQQSHLHVMGNFAEREDVRIFVATSMTGSDPNYYAWAMFSSFSALRMKRLPKPETRAALELGTGLA
ncbi:DUF6212 domain-containing protein [Teichococcus wenyumeiae]|uniref:DUF6212 domain-containing protein n=1 Tax=Teichococcus wenyumeiae TaxID=2478470 RepID=UPI00131498BF|nr:DUF6212 domain-containing protein [Pseudoroseomonas wenyumeiae]